MLDIVADLKGYVVHAIRCASLGDGRRPKRHTRAGARRTPYIAFCVGAITPARAALLPSRAPAGAKCAETPALDAAWTRPGRGLDASFQGSTLLGVVALL